MIHLDLLHLKFRKAPIAKYIFAARCNYVSRDIMGGDVKKPAFKARMCKCLALATVHARSCFSTIEHVKHVHVPFTFCFVFL